MSDYVANEKETFEYTYSAKQQEEIEAIRSKYIPKKESKMEQLRKLDKQAETPGQIIGLVLGTVGALVMGFGMCCCMVWADALMIPGIFIGIFGMAMAGLAYPAYLKVTKTQRAKVAEKILALSAELSLEN